MTTAPHQHTWDTRAVVAPKPSTGAVTVPVP